MARGFMTDTDELKIQAAVKRLLPSARRGDVHAFCDGVRKIKARYGHDIADEGMRRAMIQVPGICDKMFDSMPEEARKNLTDISFEGIAEVIGNAGLRLEDHIRITDDGVGITKDAVNAILECGIPTHMVESEGCDSLEGFGIDRTGGFWHPLSEVHKADDIGLDDDGLNFWAVASMMISYAQGWMEAETETASRNLKVMVLHGSPTINFDTLLYRSRYDDRALLRLCSLCVAGLENIANRAMNK